MENEVNIQEATEQALNEAGGVVMNEDGDTIESGQKSAENTEGSTASDQSQANQSADSGVKEGEGKDAEDKADTGQSRTGQQFEKLTRSNRGLKQEVDSKDARITELESRLNSQAQPIGTQGAQQGTQEDAVKQLRSLLGLDGLEQKLAESGNQETERQNVEEDARLNAKIEKVGLKTGQDIKGLEEEIYNFIDQSPLLANMKDRQGNPLPGVRELAYDSLNASRMQEVGVRVANRELLKHQEKQIAANSESSGVANAKGSAGNSGNIQQDTRKAMSDAGVNSTEDIEW